MRRVFEMESDFEAKVEAEFDNMINESKGIFLNYDVDDYQEDLKTIQELGL
jgi:hypothetical protein